VSQCGKQEKEKAVSKAVITVKNLKFYQYLSIKINRLHCNDSNKLLLRKPLIILSVYKQLFK